MARGFGGGMNGPAFETEIDPAELFNMFFGGGGFGGGGFGGQPGEEYLAELNPRFGRCLTLQPPFVFLSSAFCP